MDNDWDLFAVVKSFTAAAFSSSTTTAPVNNINMSAAEGPFLSTGSMSTFLDDDTSFVFPSLKEDRPDGPFEGLEEFCKEFSIDLAQAAAASGIISTTTNTLPVGQVYRQQIQPSQGIHQMQPQHLNLQMQTENPLIGSSLSIQKTNSRPSRPCKRKNKQKMVVRMMTQEELYADSWAWRKYGRKHIKGSPYPRNYYRCSTSKGCAARKHVEKNPEDPALFVVSYSGEHTHPRQQRWSSFSRSTQTKLISPAITSCEPSTNANIPICLPNSSCSSSSLASSSSFSPTTPLVEGQNPSQNEDVEMVKEHVEVEYEDEDVEMVEEHVEVEYEDEDEDILIPNVFMSEEIFRGFRELGVIKNGSAHSSDLQAQPWTSTSSTATFNASGRGGD